MLSASEIINGFKRGCRDFSNVCACGDFSSLSLRGVSFRNARLDGCDFSHCDLTGADFSGASLNGCRFALASLGEAKFDRADMRRSTLTGAFFEKASFREAVLDGAHLCRSDLKSADFAGASLMWACTAQEEHDSSVPVEERKEQGGYSFGPFVSGYGNALAGVKYSMPKREQGTLSRLLGFRREQEIAYC